MGIGLKEDVPLLALCMYVCVETMGTDFNTTANHFRMLITAQDHYYDYLTQQFSDYILAPPRLAAKLAAYAFIVPLFSLDCHLRQLATLPTETFAPQKINQLMHA
jgi:hypothetical protein